MKKASVKSLIINFIIACVFAAIYVALTEQLTVTSVIVGLAISVIALLLTQSIFLTGSYASSFTVSGYYIIYVSYLFFIILKSALVSLAYIFTKNIGINLIRYTTKLQDDNLKSMLANAITLTPGTVTADVKGDVIEVMKLCKICKLDQAAGFAKIEKVIAKMDKGNML